MECADLIDARFMECPKGTVVEVEGVSGKMMCTETASLLDTLVATFRFMPDVAKNTDDFLKRVSVAGLNGTRILLHLDPA